MSKKLNIGYYQTNVIEYLNKYSQKNTVNLLWASSWISTLSSPVIARAIGHSITWKKTPSPGLKVFRVPPFRPKKWQKKSENYTEKMLPKKCVNNHFLVLSAMEIAFISDNSPPKGWKCRLKEWKSFLIVKALSHSKRLIWHESFLIKSLSRPNW